MCRGVCTEVTTVEDLKSFFMDKSEPSLPSSKSLKERGPKLSDEQRVVDLLARRVHMRLPLGMVVVVVLLALLLAPRMQVRAV